MNAPDGLSVEPVGDANVLRVDRDLPVAALMDVMQYVADRRLDRRVWDLPGFSYSTDEVDRIAAHGRRLWRGPGRTAYLADTDLAFGVLRMLETWREEDRYETRVFRDEAEAVSWVAGEPP